MTTTWNDVNYQFNETAHDEVTAAHQKPHVTSGLVTATIVTTDGRKVEAFVHQGSRSVYPKKG